MVHSGSLRVGARPKVLQQMARSTDLPSDTTTTAGPVLEPPPIEVPVALSQAPRAGELTDDPGGEPDTDDGPEPSPDVGGSVATLRAEILEKVAEYARRRWTPQPYIP